MDNRWLTAADAARYVGLDTEAFRRKVRTGVFPRASYALGPQSPRWDRSGLDQVMNGRKDSPGSMREAVDALVQKIRAEPTKARSKTARRRDGEDLRIRPQVDREAEATVIR